MVDKKRIANIVLPLIVLADMVLYNYCSSTCSFLKGSVAGIDMKYVGLIIPLPLIALALLKQDLLYLAALSFGIGGEIKLVSFQIGSNVFCPYCLTAAAIIVLLFVLNFRRSRMILAASCLVAGFLFFQLTFHGSALPVYAHEAPALLLAAAKTSIGAPAS
jgi:uncharacterized membrane protein